MGELNGLVMSVFAKFLDTSNISVTKLFESLVNLEQIKVPKLPEVTKFAKLLLVLPAINALRGQSFSAIKRTTTNLRSAKVETD